MAFVERALMLFFIVMAVLSVSSMAAVYKVGDAAGWTTEGHVDYKKWAASKAFKVGDTIDFEYDPKIHNVLEVSFQNYKTCNTTAPLATYTTGKDAIPIKKNGHFFFICGVPHHCEAGQKVDIRVASDTPHGKAPSPSKSTPAPSSSPSTESNVPAPAPAPSKSSASLPSKDLVGKLAAALGFVALVGFAY